MPLIGRDLLVLVVFDTEVRIQQINPAMEAMNGVPATAHVGRRLPEVLPGINTEQMEAAMRRCWKPVSPG
ncbi:PAS domain-containing protein [Streptomyces sp. NPDC051917]|uniref:PAS domain-containing protein n=1 Tax=Streptomyces sp. NPDC051917 TaxID=3154754 RepID=UPI00344F127D